MRRQGFRHRQVLVFRVKLCSCPATWSRRGRANVGSLGLADFKTRGFSWLTCVDVLGVYGMGTYWA